MHLSGEEEEEETDHQICNLTQYHPHLRKDKVKEVMSQYVRQPGSYLIRKSQSQEGYYTVSVMHTENHLYHFKLQQQGRMFSIVPDKIFPTVAAMLEYYSRHDIPGNNVKHIRLKHPIWSPPEPVARVMPVPNSPPQSVLADSRNGGEPERSAPFQNPFPSYRCRPPEPLPDFVSSDHYAIPRDVGQSQLVALLSQEEDEMDGACSCGIPHQVSHLPQGWEVHRVHRKEDASNFGKLFFYNTRTEETLWKLPGCVSAVLTEEGRRTLDDLGLWTTKRSESDK